MPHCVAFIARSSAEAVGHATTTFHERPGDVLMRPRNFVPVRHWLERAL
ncbi:hypothetical protein [Nonomuraea diastatica]|nr:hypothetical protein [Nonomuraea diastatica]